MNANPPSSSSTGWRKVAERGSRRSAVSAVVFLVVAVLAAAGAAATLVKYLDARRAASPVSMTPLVVAARPLALGTTLTEDALTTMPWPSGSLPEGAVTDAKPLIGRVLMVGVTANELITDPKLASIDAGRGLAAVLPEGSLAVAVAVNDVVGVAGFIHPGDRVDVIVTMKPREESGAANMAKVILQNVQVLAVGKQVDRPEGAQAKPMQATVATLMVTVEEAERLALASTRGNILLGLRNRLYASETETLGVTPEDLLRGDLRKPPPVVHGKSQSRAVAASAAAAPPKEQSQVVEILRGDRFEKRQFQETPKTP